LPGYAWGRTTKDPTVVVLCPSAVLRALSTAPAAAGESAWSCSARFRSSRTRRSRTAVAVLAGTPRDAAICASERPALS
jgi:hypothetical protein